MGHTSGLRQVDDDNDIYDDLINNSPLGISQTGNDDVIIFKKSRKSINEVPIKSC